MKLKVQNGEGLDFPRHHFYGGHSVAAFDFDKRAKGIMTDDSLSGLTKPWFLSSIKHRYSYNFSWLSRPIIQYPQDIVAVQELIWSIRPDLIIETGIAHGGSLILSASMLAMIDYCEAVEAGVVLDPKATKRRVLGIDVDIRDHNRAAIEQHPLAHHIDMLQGSSVSSEIIGQVHTIASKHERVMVLLDSNHTHEHVLVELEAYAPLTSSGSYCVVFDTVVEDLPKELYPDRPWGPGDNPKTAVWEYLRRLKEEGRQGVDGGALDFEVDKALDDKLQISVAPEGYLRRI